MRSLRQPLFSVALICTVVAVPALAQQTPASYPPPCEASKVSKADSDRAHTVFLSGKQYLDESNYDKAISYFNDAYSIDCSVHGILPIIATAFERRGDRAEAVRALEEYARRAPNAPDREIIERRIKNLKDQLAREQAAAPPPVASAAATAAPVPSAAPEPPPPLPVAAIASSAPEGPQRASSGAAPWIVVGVGGVAVLTGVALYAVGAGDISSAVSECGGGRTNCPGDVASKGNTGRTLETVGLVAGGVGLASVAAGLVWYFMAPAPANHSARVSPVVSPGYLGLAMGGTL